MTSEKAAGQRSRRYAERPRRWPVGAGGHRSVAADVSIIDTGRPGIDRREAGRRSRAQPRLTQVKLTAPPGWSQTQNRQAHMLLFDDHLVKPVEIDELQEILGSEAPT